MDEKSMAKAFMMKVMESALKRAPHNVPQPLPVIEEKAQNRLNADDLISWKLMLKEWQKVSEEGKKTIAKLLVLNSHNVLETIDFTKGISDDLRDTVDFVTNHPEYKRQDTDFTQNPMEEIMRDLGLSDD